MQDSVSPAGVPVLETRGLSKAFDDVVVLSEVEFDLREGEVLALVGENGAGKSTLMKILAGVHQPTAGSVLLDGRPDTITSPLEARRKGIILIHQEPLSFPHLSIAENIHLGSQDAGLFRPVNWRVIREAARMALTPLGVVFDVDQPMNGLSIADQQMVEIACALAARGRVIIMDEPTAALTPSETDRLLAIISRLRAEGRSIVFISHRLNEVRRIADRILVLRDGRVVTCRPASTFASEDEIVRAMIGRDIATDPSLGRREPGEALLAAEGLGLVGRFAEIGFTLRAGEVLGLGGLVGAGRTDLARALFGLAPADAGAVFVRGRKVRITDAERAIAHGLAMVPEDRAHDAIFADLSVAKNITAASLGKAARRGLLDKATERGLAEEAAARLKVRLASVEQPIRTLSGGNQQKTILARWLLTEPEILILDEPTRGVDVGMKAEIHRLIRALAAEGKAVLLISSDMHELLTLSDRVLVMSEGRITAEIPHAELSEEAIMRAAVPMGRG